MIDKQGYINIIKINYQYLKITLLTNKLFIINVKVYMFKTFFFYHKF